MLPVVAIVGRPNVGKSTLFNCLTGSRRALVADEPGVTRDRLHGVARTGSHQFIVIDTGGLSDGEDVMSAMVADQAMRAVDEADAVVLVTDARAGLTPEDKHIALQLRRSGANLILAVNKSEGLPPYEAISDFQSLGFENINPISAAHRQGIRNLAERCVFVITGGEGEPAPGDVAADADTPSSTPPDNSDLAHHSAAPQEAAAAPDESGKPNAPISRGRNSARDGVRVAVVGRPNVGKSTLVNRLCGEERVIAHDMPGTTRDSILVPFSRRGQAYILVDTAGIRRRARVQEKIEIFSVIKAIQAIEEADVVILVIDATANVTEQDLTLLGHVLNAGRALCVAVNKWDAMAGVERDRVRSELDRRLRFLDYARPFFISAVRGSGLGPLMGAVDQAWASACRDMPTPELTRILQQAVEHHAPPVVRGRRVKLRYAHQGGSHPPRVIIHGNQTESVPESYTRYLSRCFREAFALEGTPIGIEYRTGDNPYQGRRNKLTPRQQESRKRLMKHVKKRR